MDLNCLFWNTGRGSPNDDIVALADATRANLIALAEYTGSSNELLRLLSSAGLSYVSVPTIGCERIQLFIAFPLGHLSHRREADRYTIKELLSPGSLKVLICVAHLPSKYHAEDVDQLHTATFFREDIERAETEAKHRNTLVFGDFNMNPFDDGMVSAAAMNSQPSLDTARRGFRTIASREFSFFYNPTWNLLGDFSGPPGTYFHATPGYLSHYWNTLDQVILRPSLADRFNKKGFSVLTMAGGRNLASGSGRPAVSDHFPLFFSLNLD